MFHVKHAPVPSNIFVKEREHILSRKSRITNIPIELLPLIIQEGEAKNVFVIVPGDLFWNIYESLPFNSGRLYAVPPQQNNVYDSRFISLSERLTMQSGGVGDKKDGGIIVLCSDCSANIPLFERATKTFYLSQPIDRDNLFDFIETNNYKKVGFVREVGEFSVRGSIIDIFSPAHNSPIRINFFEGVELFYFDISSQNVIQDLKGATINSITRGGTSTALDFFSSFLSFNYNNKTLSPVDGYDIDYQVGATAYEYSSFQSDGAQNDGCIVFTDSSIVGFQINKKIFIPKWFVGSSREEAHQEVVESITTNDWEKGDFIVHRDFGVCKYIGLGHREGSDQEFAILEFSDGAVRVSIDRFDLLSFHSKSFTKNQRLSSLNNLGPWKRALRSTKKIAKEYVESIYNNMYSRRNAEGKIAQTSLELESEFINSFKYNDTPGQSQAWNEIKNDLMGSWPMYRLLCGDVGFGKTELAIRAAFVSILSGYKVLVMAPTNILAQQLFTSFVDRLEPFGIGVGFYSKSNTPTTNKTTLNDFDKGKLQIIISTHKLLFINKIYNNIGLVIIDEEHRFGVKQKEQLKNLYGSANFLLMTATPIPRTLYISISGIKEMSIIDTPPSLRRPIITQIISQKLKNLPSIIKHELARQGQVFIVYNSVDSMEDFYSRVSRELNFARVSFVHGSLSQKIINKTMNSFRNKNCDVLIASSIIESGLDIPNANTIIIYNAHRFGLAQLYQLRGRVGRDSAQAYCYLSVPQKAELSYGAVQRLRTIIANSSLGSNYEIAKSDLEIRGPGSLFGYRQSGGMSKIGFGLYGQFLSEAADALNSSSTVVNSSSVKINIGTNISIPNEYISSHSLRASIYNKINTLKSAKDIERFEKHLFYRFGPTPKAVSNLLRYQLLKRACARSGIYRLNYNGTDLTFSFTPLVPSTVRFIVRIATSVFSVPKQVKKSDGFDIIVNVNTNTDITTKIGAFLDKLQYEKNIY